MRKKLLLGIIGTMLLVSACTGKNGVQGNESTTNTTEIANLETSGETQEETDIPEPETPSLSGSISWDKYPDFTDYIKAQQMVNSGRFETIPEKRLQTDTYAWDVKYYTGGSGVLAIKVIDLDQDGQDEMLVIKMTQVNEDNHVTASVLKQKDNLIVESPEVILLENTFRLEDERNIVFLKQVNGSYMIYSEDEKSTLNSDGTLQELRAFHYHNGELQLISEIGVAGGGYTEEDEIKKNQELAPLGLSGDFWNVEMISVQNPDVEIVCTLSAGFEGYADWDELNDDYLAFLESATHKLKPIVFTIHDESDLNAFLSENGIKTP